MFTYFLINNAREVILYNYFHFQIWNCETLKQANMMFFPFTSLYNV